ncbi:MAG: hypothetical protein WA688_07460 [Thermoplasmata archaeon]
MRGDSRPDVDGQVRAWLLITRRALWNHFVSEGEWAFHLRSMPRAQAIRQGDIGFVYLTREGQSRPSQGSSIVAVIRVEDRGRSAVPGGTALDFYPYRVPFRKVVDLGFPVPFRFIAPRIGFVGRRGNFGVYLQGQSAIQLVASDAKVMLNVLLSRTQAVGERKSLRSVEPYIGTESTA